MKTTLNKIREHSPCEESWVELLNHLGKIKPDDEPLDLRVILDLLGIDDAVWALRSLEGKDKEVRLFACDCAESVLHLYEKEHPNDTRVRDCMEAARKYAVGEIDLELLREARAAARVAARASDWASDWDADWASDWDAAWASAGAAAWDAALAARDAVWAAAWAATRDARAAARAAALDARDAAAWAAALDAGAAEQEKQKELYIKYFCS